VEVIARDRADVYADGARRGAPRAVHVADRWHLLRNLGEALRTIMGTHHTAVRRIQRDIAAEQAGRAAPEEALPITTRETGKAARHQPRQARYAEVRRLADAGTTASAIARACELDRKTVRKWLREGGPGTWDRPSSAGILGPCLDQLERRWAEGSRNATRLWAELASTGFRGSRSMVRAWATRRRRALSDALDPKPAVKEGWKPPSTAQVTRLLQADPAELMSPDRMFLDKLLAEVPALAEVRNLARGFAALIRKEGTGTLDGWLAAAAGTPLGSFAEGLGKDLAAIRAALETPWSTGPVEGQISRLKTIKRTMYGRAGFSLLRSRVLHAA
jgi:transposase